MVVGSNDFLQHVASAFCPDERLGVDVVGGDLVVDGSRHEVHDEARMLAQPLLYERMFVLA